MVQGVGLAAWLRLQGLGRRGWIGDMAWELGSPLRGREMMRQPRQQLAGVPGGPAEAWALPGRL